jgi:hypothetical protein
MTEEEILYLIESDPWMMEALSVAKSLSLKNWILGAGFVRNKVWDHLSGKTLVGVDTPDIDLVYYDLEGNDEETDEKLSKRLSECTGFNWEIVNQSYAHKWNNLDPYTSTEDAISKWPETVTAIGVTVNSAGKLRLFAPYGITDLINFIVRPTPTFLNKINVLKDRVQKKKWLEKWPKIKIVENVV